MSETKEQVKHTPGPWRVGPWSVGRVISIINATGGNIADIGFADDEDQANARLISAAPELLEALRTVVDALLYYDGHASNPHNPKGWTESAGHSAYESGQSAIAKAEGRND